MKFINRFLLHELRALSAGPRGRLIAITGARQVGKSTLSQKTFDDFPVISMDSPVERATYERMSPEQWISRFPYAVIDEVQKLPPLFETIKACHDRNPHTRFVLLGSSQILLMKGIRETLAGRIALTELFPLCLPELCAGENQSTIPNSRIIRLITAPAPVNEMSGFFPPDATLSSAFAVASTQWEKLLHWGGMPAIQDSSWSDADRFSWLADYHATYLQRDLTDLARLDHLEPFVRAQKAAALRTGQVINFSALARLADISPPTAKQFLRYLEISYQVILLPAWYKNREKRLSRQPKLHFIDAGIRRAILQQSGAIHGPEYESTIVTEIIKQCRTLKIPVTFSHLRTPDGREVDLLIERADGFIAIECKQSSSVASTDARHLHDLQPLLNKPLLLSIVLSEDPLPRPMNNDKTIWALPAPLALM